MKRYEVYWGRFKLGELTIDGENYKYDPMQETINKLKMSIILDPAVMEPHEGAPIQFFKSYIEASYKGGFDKYQLIEV